MILMKKYTLFDLIIVPLKSSPILTIIRIIDEIISALMPSLLVLVTANFINTALAIFAGEKNRAGIYSPLILIALIIAFQYINGVLMSFVTTKMGMKLNETFRSAIVVKRAKLEYRHIENNDSWDVIYRVCGDPASQICNGFDTILSMAGMVISIVSLLLILFAQVWWAGIVIIGFSVPLFYVSMKSGKKYYEVSKDAAKLDRKAEYLRKILTSRENIEERTMFGYVKHIDSKWYDKYEIARKMKLKVQTKNFIRMKSASLITIIITSLITFVLIVPLGKGGLTIGMFIALITATFNLVQIVSGELDSITSKIANNREYLKDLSLFSGFSEQEGALDKPIKTGFVFECLEFRNVSFAYPDTEKQILDNCSFKIVKNMHYAFVGINGAGKTTITKLITGLYTSFNGEILINNKSIRKYTQAELKAIIAVIYQDFSKYYISLRENILLGNVNGVSDERIKSEIELIGLDDVIGKLPNGIETHLGKIKENGVDLSGGEWQRVAISRTLVSDAPVTILDEPTAALDPMAESKLYEIFGRISVGKTTILITHRLGAAKLADEIFVIDEGKVSEQGSHDSLIRKNAIYAKMYEAQRSWYK